MTGMRRGCSYIFPDGHQCAVAGSKHGGIVLSVPNAGEWTEDDDRLNHPVLAGNWDRASAERTSERHRFVRDHGLDALRARDLAEYLTPATEQTVSEITKES